LANGTGLALVLLIVEGAESRGRSLPLWRGNAAARRELTPHPVAAPVYGKTVEVYDQGRDESGRWIARVVVDGVDVNKQLVATGNAWHYAAYSTDQTLATIQAQAQAQKQGLWSAASPTPPWVYRQGGSAS